MPVMELAAGWTVGLKLGSFLVVKEGFCLWKVNIVMQMCDLIGKWE